MKADNLSEQHLAEIALSIRNRWNIATFVKKHEIVILDDEESESTNIVDAKIESADLERGLNVILQNLDLDRAFKLEVKGKDKLHLKLVEPSMMPKWIERASQDLRVPPEGVFECPHCGKRFNNDFELSLHTKLHYII